MPAITTLYTLPRTEQASWVSLDTGIDGKNRVLTDARRVVADWADCSLSRISWDDNDMICVDEEPVGFLERKFVRHPIDLHGSKPVDLARFFQPVQQAAE